MDKKGGITFFRRKFLVSHCRRISWVCLQCFKKIGVSKNFMRFCQKFLVSQCRKTWWASLQCFRKFGVSSNFCISDGGGITFLPGKLLSHSTEKGRCGTVRCFRKFRVSQNFMHKKGVSLNSDERFCLTVPENFLRELYCFWRKSGVETFSGLKKGYHVFLSKIFGLTVPKNFVQEPISVSIISGIKKCWG